MKRFIQYLKTILTTDISEVPLSAINLIIIIGSIFFGVLTLFFSFASLLSLFSNLFK